MTVIDREAELSRMAELGERGVEGATHILGRDDEHTPPVCSRPVRQTALAAAGEVRGPRRVGEDTLPTVDRDRHDGDDEVTTGALAVELQRRQPAGVVRPSGERSTARTTGLTARITAGVGAAIDRIRRDRLHGAVTSPADGSAHRFVDRDGFGVDRLHVEARRDDPIGCDAEDRHTPHSERGTAGPVPVESHSTHAVSSTVACRTIRPVSPEIAAEDRVEFCRAWP